MENYFYQVANSKTIFFAWQWKFKRAVCVSPPKGLDFSFSIEFFQFKDELVKIPMAGERAWTFVSIKYDGVKIRLRYGVRWRGLISIFLDSNLER
jgi:hypothetical protein